MKCNRTATACVAIRGRPSSGLYLSCGVWFVAAGLFILALTSCSSTTDPGGDGALRITYSPSSDNIIVQLDGAQLFQVNLENAPSTVVTYCRGDSVLATGREYIYQGVRVGADSLCAVVALPDTSYRKEWRIWVDGQSATLPPLVPDQSVGHGPVPGSLVVVWTKPATSLVPRTLRRYHIRISYDGILTEANWDQAISLDMVDHDGGAVIGYSRTYTSDEFTAILPGQEVWVAVRVEDVAGLFSPLDPAGLQILISAPYMLQGFVKDHNGSPLHGVIVDYGCDTCKTSTNLDGWFELGPFRDIDEYVLTTTTLDENSSPDVIDAYYDFRTDSLDVETEQPLELVLVARRGLDPDCTSALYDGDFLAFMMYMTRTNQTISGRPNQQLLKWESYPLAVYIEPNFNDAHTFPLDSLAVEALAIWNQKMGEDYLVEVAEPVDADIEVIFTNEDMFPNHGIAELVNDGGLYKINQVIPFLMRIRVLKSLNNPVYALEVLLHEIGHTLCMGGHSLCCESVHLMCSNSAGMIGDNWPDLPINDDEAALVRAIRNLPQAVPMDQYETE